MHKGESQQSVLDVHDLLSVNMVHHAIYKCTQIKAQSSSKARRRNAGVSDYLEQTEAKWKIVRISRNKIVKFEMCF